MNMLRSAITSTVIAALTCSCGAFAASPPGTAFTYQGILKDGGVPANGSYDFNLFLFDASAGGNQVGSNELIDNVSVTNGLVTVNPDFGALPWNAAEARWLEIRVRPGASVGLFTPLTPRQPLNGSPYSLATRGLVVTSFDWVGIKTDTPVAPLTVEGNVSFPAAHFHAASNFNAMESVSEGGTAVHGEGHIGVQGVGNDDFGVGVYGTVSSFTGVNYAVVGHNLSPDGFAGWFNGRGYFLDDVGIGTTSPAVHLHVATGTDASASGGGFLQLGSSAGANLAFDNNEIMARNNGAVATLALNVEGGDVNILQNGGGQVGIGTNAPGFLLEVDGNAAKPGGGSWSNSSDIRLKKNIADIEHPLDTMLSLRGVTFEYKDPASINELPGRRTGMIAQEVESVMPDWVDINTRGHKTITFRGFEALTVEAMRELRQHEEEQINALRAANAALHSENQSLQQRLDALELVVANLSNQVKGSSR